MTMQAAYSRADITHLKQMSRNDLFHALRSFDESGMAEDAFAWKAMELLDPQRIPDLAEAIDEKDLPRALNAVSAACGQLPPAEKTEQGRTAAKVADDVLKHRFTFYGETHQLPDNIDWEFNPGTAHWGHDLHRFSYLSPLVQSFHNTGDDRYARKAVDLILDWITKCDFARSFVIEKYAFGSYLNLAIHAGAWSRTVNALAACAMVEPAELLRILKSLHDHLAYLQIVTNGHSGNWPTIGCMGMLATLENLPVFRDTARFAGYCRSALHDQIAEQVLPDGVQDELTPHYHQCVVRNLVNARRSLRTLGDDLTPETLAILRKMVHYSRQTIMPDGSKHLAFNDSDPGSVPLLCARTTEEGPEESSSPVREPGPELFPYAGVAFLRQRPEKGDLYMAFDAGPFGRSHQHEDKLGFWLFAYGRNFLVDPGRHLYDRSAASYYNYLISTRAHSTILVDGCGQNSRACPETWIAGKPLDVGWSVKEGEIRAAGSYDLGYGPKNEVNVIHHREIVFVGERCWIVFDTLTGKGEHAIESRFQFAPGKVMLENTRVRTDFPDSNLLLWPAGALETAGAVIEEGRENPRGGWYSDRYNHIEPAPALSLTQHGRLPMRAATLLFPYRGTALPEVAFAFRDGTAVLHTEELGEMRVRASNPHIS